MSIRRRESLVSETVGTSPRVRAALLGCGGTDSGRREEATNDSESVERTSDSGKAGNLPPTFSHRRREDHD